MVECQGRCNVVAVLPGLELAAVDSTGVVMHASTKSYAAHAAKEGGWTAARAARINLTPFQ